MIAVYTQPPPMKYHIIFVRSTYNIMYIIIYYLRLSVCHVNNIIIATVNVGTQILGGCDKWTRFEIEHYPVIIITIILYLDVRRKNKKPYAYRKIRSLSTSTCRIWYLSKCIQIVPTWFWYRYNTNSLKPPMFDRLCRLQDRNICPEFRLDPNELVGINNRRSTLYIIRRELCQICYFRSSETGLQNWRGIYVWWHHPL